MNMENKRYQHILDGEPRTYEETLKFFKETEEFEKERQRCFQEKIKKELIKEKA